MGDNLGGSRRMSNQNQTVYLKVGQNVLVTDRHVTLSDIAKLECSDQAILRQLKQKKIFSFKEATEGKRKKQRVVFSVLKLIELIHEEYPGVDITNEGESDFILEYLPKPEESRWITTTKTVMLSIIVFFGSAFTIMAFNNDVSVGDVFSKLYFQVTGEASNGVTPLEICYSIGLAVGICVFFNHVGHKKITPDPTPIQVEMRKYEKDIDTAFIDNAGRKGHNIDVS